MMMLSQKNGIKLLLQDFDQWQEYLDKSNLSGIWQKSERKPAWNTKKQYDLTNY